MPEYSFGKLRNEICIVWYDADGKRHRHTLGTADPSEAERIAPSVYAQLTRPAGKTVADLWRAYELDKAGRAVVGTMKHTWKALEKRFGPMDGTDVTIADCRAHTAARRRAGRQDGTIHTELGHLRMVLLWAAKHGLIDKAPAIERPAKPAPKFDHLSRDQMRDLINGTTIPHIRLFIILAAGTGARSSALLDLQWSRCDMVRGVIDLCNPDIKVPHKGRAVVPMNRMILVALKEAFDSGSGNYVIEWAGKPVRSVKRGLAQAAKTAGLAHVSPHMIRHSAAVHMAEAGIPMEEIAQFLGHSNVQVTRNVYARFSPNHLRTAAAALEYDDIGSMNLKRAT